MIIITVPSSEMPLLLSILPPGTLKEEDIKVTVKVKAKLEPEMVKKIEEISGAKVLKPV